ncbi:MAG TPA: 2Fe-2S iron-sulfur cluster-binding protein [Burkholderiaceae bacterium]|nr:2Fe-2S iron-sulfur cluster-binding protein [Burkholderiaceae bacterium]
MHATPKDTNTDAQYFTVTVLPTQTQFSISTSQTILQAAERALIYPLSSCRNGTCRTCISTLISGQVRYNIEWPGLSAEEKQSGMILPCCAYPMSDVSLQFGQK